MTPGELVERRFRLLHTAGKGAFGTVFRAVDTATAGDVAIKIIDRDATDFDRFEREAEVLATVRHANIVKYVAHGLTDEGEPYLAMEWLDGIDLASRLSRGVLAMNDALLIVARAAQGLAAAHALGVVHRDIKPSNLFLVGTSPNDVRVIDFGVARVLNSGNNLTSTGTVLGTPAYMSPEQASGSLAISPRADVFALGCVLFECLTGRPPFIGSNAPAILAKLLEGSCPRLKDWMPDAPPILEVLLAHMLARDPSDRFTDAGAVAAAISGVIRDPTATHGSHQRAAISWRAPTTQSVVLVRAALDDATITTQVSEVIGTVGGEIRFFASSCVVAGFTSETMSESANRAARCALLVSELGHSMQIAIVTTRDGTAIARPSAIDSLLGSNIATSTATAPVVVVDTATASHLASEYEIRKQDGYMELHRRRASEKPRSTFHLVGRAREIAALQGTHAQVLEECRARIAFILGESGIGKTRLIDEFVIRLDACNGSPTMALRAFCDRPTSVSPYAGIAQLVGDYLSKVDGVQPGCVNQANEALMRLGLTSVDSDFLCALMGAYGAAKGPPHIVAARDDPVLMGDAFRTAWLAFVDAALFASPLVLAIEDFHFADPATVRLLEATLEGLSDRQLLVVATMRPQQSSAVLDMFNAHEPEKVVLRPLRANVAIELAHRLGATGNQRDIERVVESAAGNPLHLIELLRVVGSGTAPESALGVIDLRLASLDSFVHRVLRAASVFGMRFSRGGVSTLLGAETRQQEVERALATAEGQGILVHVLSSDADSNDVWAFRNDLTREAAYSTLSDEDRKDAHSEAAKWLEPMSGVDPSVIAWHYQRGKAHPDACKWYEAAARAALQGRELDLVIDLTSAALSCEPVGDDRARILVLRAEAAFLRGNVGEGRHAAREAMLAAVPGSLTWTGAAAILVTAAGQAGQNAEVRRLVRDLSEHEIEPVATARRAVCLCRAATQLFASGDRDQARELMHAVEANRVKDVEVQAWLHRLQSGFHVIDDEFEAGISKLNQAAQLYTAMGDVRSHCLMRIFLGSYYVFIGEFDSAAMELDVAERIARRLGAAYFLEWTAYTRGKVVALSGRPSAAKEHLQQVRAALAGNPRMISGTHVYSAIAALRAGDSRWAEDEARAAFAAHNAVSSRAAAQALLARALTRMGRSEEALEAAHDALARLRSVGRLEENESLVHLALVEAHVSAGREDDAREAARMAVERLKSVASKLSTAARREAYLHGLEFHAETVRHAFRLGVPVPTCSMPT